MLNREACPHPIHHLSWASDTKDESWIKCDDCGELWIFEWLLGTSLPGFSRRASGLVQALAKAPEASKEPLEQLLGPEVTLKQLADRLERESAAEDARIAAQEVPR